MIEQLRCRIVRTSLGSGPEPVSVLQALAGAPGLLCLRGGWAGGGAIIASDPLVTADTIDALDRQPAVAASDEDAVGGGWFGWLAYSGRHRLGFYDHLLRLVDGQWWFEALWSDQRDAVLVQRRDEFAAALAQPPAPARPVALAPFEGPDAEAHLRAVEMAIGSIRAGEFYQANICTRLSSPSDVDGVDLFALLAGLEPAFGAYLSAGSAQVASASPELFLRRRGRSVVTKPIKGTLPRTPGNDEALRRSAKDAAENVMIVDLMRNDLGRVCETGTVRVSSLLDIEAHPGVWHLVSTVRGQLCASVRDAELLQATFPPGSVTGAPKLRAMAEIADLEAAPRSAYTGAIGFASPAWGAEFSVTIRSFEISPGRVELGVGGGITADSVPMLEWHECLHKAAPLLASLGAAFTAPLDEPSPPIEDWQAQGGLLETVLVVEGVPLRLADHLVRLDRSAREVYLHPIPDDLETRARDLSSSAQVASASGRAVLRIVLTPQDVELTCRPLGATPASTSVHVVRRRGGLWRHKWADRTGLTADEVAGMPLYVADDDTVLETSRGNVFLLRADGSLVTPPLRDDLLPGVTRRAVLDLARDQGRAVELRSFGLAELHACPAFWTSSLSGAVPLESVDGVSLPRDDAAVAALRTALIGRAKP